MKISLHYKLFGAILIAILIVVLYMTLVFQWSFDKGFLQYVNTVESAQLQKIALDFETLYKERKTWDWIAENPEEVAIVIINSYPEGNQKDRFIRRLKKNKFGSKLIAAGPLPTEIPVHFFRRVFLLDKNKKTIIGYDLEKPNSSSISIYYQNQVVGYIGAHPAKHLSDSHHLLFVKQQKLALVLVAVAGILIAAGLSFPIAYKLTNPIRKMANATRNLASGKYNTRVITSSGDELGSLAQDLNDLAATLQKNRLARSQWIADISHELRTPLSILRGKIEGLQDGVYKPSEESFKTLHEEVLHLGMIVDDLYQLSISDMGAMSYKKVEVQPCWALEQAIQSLDSKISEKGLTLETQVDIENEVSLYGDNERLKQLFTNLLANSIRYTDPGGKIRVSVENRNNYLIYTLEDSKPGVPESQLGKLFDRLYRVDPSRSRKSGGAGLGLSICYNIVSGHNGSIKAKHSELGGLFIQVQLPQS